jgi:hypothetical protein
LNLFITHEKPLPFETPVISTDCTPSRRFVETTVPAGKVDLKDSSHPNSLRTSYESFCHFSLLSSFFPTPIIVASYQSFSDVLYLTTSCGTISKSVTAV